MKILAFDTATKSCSVALTDQAAILAEITLVNADTHSLHLNSLIREVCKMARIELNDIDGYAVTRGPGSFTGLRIGISTAIGLAQASSKPICGVSTLHALANQAVTSAKIVCPMIDARRGEVYFACFSKEGQYRLTCYGTEQVLKPHDAITGIKEPCIFIGNGATLYQADIKNVLGDKAEIAPQVHNTIRASNVAWLAHQRLLRGDMDDITCFAPIYLRKSDAERNNKKQRNMTN